MRASALDVLFVPLAHDGRVTDARTLDQLPALLSSATDCVLFCHGWLYDAEEARVEAHRFFALLDDEAADCLDNRELKAVVGQARRVLGRKLDLVGMDACLMTMLEVAYQLREHVQVLVGSEEDEPNEGWPHQAILGDLTARPAMSATDLGAAIVRRYTEFYRRRDVEATQSAIDLGRLDDLVAAVDTLARALLAALHSRDVLLAVHAARRCSVTFFNGAYVDLYDFAHNLAAGTQFETVRRAAQDVVTIIDDRGGASPIIAAGSVGPRLEPTRGLSIYFPPFRDPSAFYRELDFAQRTQWAAFVDAYLRR